ncbi:MAG: RNase H family protein [Myxococcaceae bacterium]|nr:RNase H family protein [Myxococcaceae bacterium]
MTADAGRAVLELWTDGSAEGRAGRPGGWAFIAVRDDVEVASRQGGDPATTCVVMELEAVRQALLTARSKGWHRRSRLVVVSDSSIALEAAAGRFLPRPYAALAAEVRALAEALAVDTRKVRSHAGQRWNELADAKALEARLAVQAEARAAKRSRRSR